MQATHDALSRRKEQIAWSRLWWVGALVIASSLVVNLLVRSAVLALFPTQIITADHIIMLTVLGTLAAISGLCSGCLARNTPDYPVSQDCRRRSVAFLRARHLDLLDRVLWHCCRRVHTHAYYDSSHLYYWLDEVDGS